MKNSESNLHLYKWYFSYQDNEQQIKAKYVEVMKAHKSFDHVVIKLSPKKKNPYLFPVFNVPNPDGLILYERLIKECHWLKFDATNTPAIEIKTAQLSLFS